MGGDHAFAPMADNVLPTAVNFAPLDLPDDQTLAGSPYDRAAEFIGYTALNQFRAKASAGRAGFRSGCDLLSDQSKLNQNSPSCGMTCHEADTRPPSERALYFKELVASSCTAKPGPLQPSEKSQPRAHRSRNRLHARVR